MSAILPTALALACSALGSARVLAQATVVAPPSAPAEVRTYQWAVRLASSGGGGSPTEVIEPAVTVRVTVYGRWELVPRP